MKHDPKIDLLAGVMLLILAAIWGGSFFFGAYAVATVPPLTITWHRVVWAIPLLLIIVLWRRSPIPRDGRTWLAYLVMGGLNNAIPFSLIFWGQQSIDSGLASILNATTAIFGAVVAGLLLADEPLTPRKILGGVFAIIGVAVIMGWQAISQFSLTNLAQLAVLGATLSYALASVWAKLHLGQHSPQMNALGMLTGSAILMTPLVFWLDGPPTFNLPGDVIAALLGLAVMCTSVAYLMYFAILSRAGSANLMLVTVLVPPFAIILGVLFLNETLGPRDWIGFAFIATGLVVTDGRVSAKVKARLGG